MTTDTLTPATHRRNDDLLFAAVLEALPAAILVPVGVVAMLASPDDALRGASHALFTWFNPQAALAQDPLRLLLSIGMLLAYVGPGLGRMYLRDWSGIVTYLSMRGGLIVGALVGYAAFVLLFFGSGTDATVGIVAYVTAALAFSPLVVGFVSANELLQRYRDEFRT